jgi:hypothetical protein
MTPKRFILYRHVDVSGVSGPGVVAEGIVFSDETVAFRWLSDTPCTSVWPDIDAVLAVHGHGGLTEIIWLDAEPAPELEVTGAGRHEMSSMTTIYSAGDNPGPRAGGISYSPAQGHPQGLAADPLPESRPRGDVLTSPQRRATGTPQSRWAIALQRVSAIVRRSTSGIGRIPPRPHRPHPAR